MKRIFLSLLVLLCGMQMSAQVKKAPANTEPKQIALQLYSIRTVFNAGNYAETHEKIFKQLKQFGYTAVEAASYDNGKFYGVKPEQYKADLEAAGLQSMSSHTSHRLSAEELASGKFDASMKWWKEAIKAHKAAGLKYIVTPSDHFPKTMAEAKVLCEYHNAIGKLCKENGITYGYHSHSFEFQKIENTDQIWYDYFVQNTNPEYVFFQMDVYWCVMAQMSPVEYFKKYPGRFICLHIKDKYELGQSGMVGFDAILKAFKTSGMKDYVVEMERTDGSIDIMEGVKRCAKYLQKAKYVKPSYQ